MSHRFFYADRLHLVPNCVFGKLAGPVGQCEKFWTLISQRLRTAWAHEQVIDVSAVKSASTVLLPNLKKTKRLVPLGTCPNISGGKSISMQELVILRSSSYKCVVNIC